MKPVEAYAKMIDSAIRLVNVKEIRIRTIEDGLKSYAKVHAIEFMDWFTEPGRLKGKYTLEEVYTKWIKEKE